MESLNKLKPLFESEPPKFYRNLLENKQESANISKQKFPH